MNTMMARTCLTLVFAVSLLACGGGGGGGGGGAAVPPPPPLVSIGGMIIGLADGRSISLVLDGEPSETFAEFNAAGFEFVFVRELARGARYNVSIGLNPLNQLCEMRNASGTANANVRDIEIRCWDTLLNDTGVSAGEDGATGRDTAAAAGNLAKVGAGRAGFDFSRVCNSGEVAGSGSCPSIPTRGAGVNEWACTRDNVTGTFWQVRTESSAAPWSEAALAAATASGSNLCGRDDWRLPTPWQLSGIVDSGATATAPSIDGGFFPDTAPVAYWTDTESLQDPDSIRVVEFGNGAVGITNRANPSRLRLASGVELEQAFSFEAADVLVDGRSGLMWLSTDETGHWEAALGVAGRMNSTSPGGYADWRLPDRSELSTLLDQGQRGPTVDPSLAGFIKAEGYWTSSAVSVQAGSAQLVWVVDFDNGDVTVGLPSSARRIILVRNRTHGT